MLFQMGKAPEKAGEEKRDVLAEIVDVVVHHAEEVGLLLGARIVFGLRDHADIPVEGKQRGAAALNHGVNHGVGAFHVVVKPLEVGIVAALAGFL
jgi:hypothetical protein